MIRKPRTLTYDGRQKDRAAFTLLEVLLATVILASALTAVGQLASNGRAAALRAELESEAAIICQSRLDEILAGAVNIDGRQTVWQSTSKWRTTATLTDGPSRTLDILTLKTESATASISFELRRLVSRRGVER